MVKLITEQRDYLIKTGVHKNKRLTEVLEIANASGIEKIFFGKFPVLEQVNFEAKEMAVVICTEPCMLAQHAEIKIMELLGRYENKIAFITTNQALKGISSSIHILAKEERERTMAPIARHDWNAEVSDKTKNISMVYSKKTTMTGHALRGFIFDKYHRGDKIDFFTGTGQNTKEELYENRVNSIRPYRYNLIIENTISSDHISGQIKDAILGKCIPLLLGGKNCIPDILADVYGLNLNGVIDLRNKGLHETIINIGEEFYTASHDIINQNHLIMKNKVRELGWDGVGHFQTDFTWLGDIIVQKMKRAVLQYSAP